MATFRYYMYQSPRIIEVASPTTQITCQELIDDVRDFEDELEYGMQHAHLANASGIEALGGGGYVGITIELQNAQVRFEARNGPAYTLCEVAGGNLVAVDADDQELNPIAPSAYTTVVRTSSSSATLQELTSIQHSSFEGGVTIDADNGTSGVTFPTGTGEQPVDNIDDAKTIAQTRGLSNFYLLSNLSLDSNDDVDEYDIIGQNIDKTRLTVASGCSTDNSYFETLTVTGSLSGFTVLRDCRVATLAKFRGDIKNSMLVGPINFTSAETVDIIDCVCGAAAGSFPTLNFRGQPTSLGLRGYSGCIRVASITNASTIICADFLSGVMLIATSCNNGNIIIRGPAKVVDNSTGGTIDTTHVVNPYRFADQTWDEAVASHVTTDTMGAALRDSKDESIGKWEVDPDTHVLKMYRSDGVTVLASFTLATSGTDVPAYVSRTPM